jgi:hypothetical protein
MALTAPDTFVARCVARRPSRARDERGVSAEAADDVTATIQRPQWFGSSPGSTAEKRQHRIGRNLEVSILVGRTRSCGG